MERPSLDKVTQWARRRWPELFWAAVAMLILGPLLRPGFVFALDLVWPERWVVLPDYERFLFSYPLQYVVVLLQHVVPLWVVQKAVLWGTLWGAGVLAYRFLPVGDRSWAKLLASLAFVLNPFVYTRLVAGNWMILAAYALLPWLLRALTRFTDRPGVRATAELVAALWCIQVLNVHMAVIAGTMAFLWWAVAVAATASRGAGSVRPLMRCTALLVGALLVTTAYWTVPAVLVGGTGGAPDARELRAFAPAARPGDAVAWDIAGLGGFWGLDAPWADQYRWPQDGVSGMLARAGVLLLVGAGLLAHRAGLMRLRTFLFLALAVLCGVVLGSGTALAPFRALNRVLYWGVPFWWGFRDGTKWLAMPALAYAVLLPWGVAYLMRVVRRPRIVLAVAFAAVLLWAHPLWTGGAWALRVAHYPASWRAVSQLLAQDAPGERTLFLPWHRYFTTQFAGLSDFPAFFAFVPRAVTCRNVELGSVAPDARDPAYVRLDVLIRNQRATAGDVVRELRAQGIIRVVLFTDLVGSDPFAYGFLRDPTFRPAEAPSGVRIWDVAP